MENFQHFIAGWGGGVFGVLVGHPLDTIKIYQQTSNFRLTTKEAIKLIIKKDGIPGFYRGLLFPLFGSGFLNSIYFGVYDSIFKLLQSSRGYENILSSNSGWIQDLFIAGSLGGAVQASITSPGELIKIRMQVGKGVLMSGMKTRFSAMSTYRTVLDFHKNFGIRGFFVGFVPTLLRDSIGGGIYISSYQYIKFYLNADMKLAPEFFETFVAGGIAGLVSWMPIVIPFDTLKSRMQADDLKNPKFKGMFDCSVNLYRQNGLSGFFKGFSMIAVRSVPVNISILYGYELILWFFKRLDV